jgi:N6-L-threonylcarbamoyladenine synthase
VDVLAAKSLAALKQTKLNRLVVAGGVGANRQLREALSAAAKKRNFFVHYPDLSLCTDNGAMIALAGALRLQRWPDQSAKDYAFTVKPRWDLTSLAR